MRFKSIQRKTRNMLHFFQHWIDPGKRVSTQIRGIVPVTLYLGVKFYAADPSRLVEEITRYLYNVYGILTDKNRLLLFLVTFILFIFDLIWFENWLKP